jgi:hypothetical protein
MSTGDLPLPATKTTCWLPIKGRVAVLLILVHIVYSNKAPVLQKITKSWASWSSLYSLHSGYSITECGRENAVETEVQCRSLEWVVFCFESIGLRGLSECILLWGLEVLFSSPRRQIKNKRKPEVKQRWRHVIYRSISPDPRHGRFIARAAAATPGLPQRAANSLGSSLIYLTYLLPDICLYFTNTKVSSILHSTSFIISVISHSAICAATTYLNPLSNLSDWIFLKPFLVLIRKWKSKFW